MTIKSILAALLLVALPGTAAAQTVEPVATATTAAPQPRFAFFSRQQVLSSMVDYIKAQHDIDELKAKYDAEMQRSENDFNQRYEDFLEHQRELAPSIFQKRQAELRDLMEKNVAFKQEARRLLSEARTEALSPVYQRIDAKIKELGRSAGYAFIINSDNDALPYVDTTLGVDITSELIKVLQ